MKKQCEKHIYYDKSNCPICEQDKKESRCRKHDYQFKRHSATHGHVFVCTKCGASIDDGDYSGW